MKINGNTTLAEVQAECKRHDGTCIGCKYFKEGNGCAIMQVNVPVEWDLEMRPAQFSVRLDFTEVQWKNQLKLRGRRKVRDARRRQTRENDN